MKNLNLKLKLIGIGLLAGLLFPAALLCAEETQSNTQMTVQLDELIQMALLKNPDVISMKAEWEAAKKDIWIDSSLPDPMAEVAPGNEENRLGVMQEIPFVGKLYIKGKMASDDAGAAYFRYQAIERDIVNRLSNAYYDLYFIDASRDVINEIKGLLKRFESVASASYSNRSGSQRDVAKAQAEVSMSIERLYGLEERRESIAALINAILDRDPMEPVGRAALPPKPILKQSLIELINLALLNRQEIKEAEQLVSKSTHAKNLARLAYIPDLAVGFEYNQVKMEERDDYWMVPIRFNIPVWQNRIIPEIQKANKLEDAGKARLLQAKNTTFSEVKDSYYRYQSAMKIADLYEVAVIPQAQIALNADLAGYESNQSDFLNLLDSERIYFNAKLSQIQFYTEALKAHADLVRATGLDLASQEKEEGEHDQSIKE